MENGNITFAIPFKQSLKARGLGLFLVSWVIPLALVSFIYLMWGIQLEKNGAAPISVLSLVLGTLTGGILLLILLLLLLSKLLEGSFFSALLVICRIIELYSRGISGPIEREEAVVKEINSLYSRKDAMNSSISSLAEMARMLQLQVNKFSI